MSTAVAMKPSPPASPNFIPSQLFDVDAIEPDPHNPRKDFPKDAMQELTASVALHGVRSPIEVRRTVGGQKYRIVFGERRWRAAKAAGLKAIPVIVRQLTDIEAADVQLDENLKRADLSPLEVAGGYQRQLELGRTIDQVCERAGRKRSAVYATLQLLQLGEAGRKALGEQRITTSVAQLVARVPKALQGEALAIVEGGQWQRPLTYQQATAELATVFTVDLKKAPWKLTDETLPCVAKICADCPKRAGNAPDLFPDVKSPDTCTDPVSYRQKLHAFAKADVEKAGFKLLKPDDAPPEKLFWNGGRGPVSDESGYVDPTSRCYDDAQSRPYKDLLTPEQRKKLTVVALDADGKQRELLERSGLMREVKKAGLLKERKKGQALKALPSAPKEYKPPEPTLEEKVDQALVGKCVEAVEKRGLTPAILKRLVICALWNTDYLPERRGVSPEKRRLLGYGCSEKDFDKVFGKLSGAEMAGLLYEAVVLDRLYVDGGGNGLAKECEALGVDTDKVESQMEAAEAAKAEAKRKSDPLDSPAVAKAKAAKASGKGKR